MKNIALYFDRPHPGGGGNAAALAALLHRSDGQIVWSPDAGPPRAPRRRPLDAVRRQVGQAYDFLGEHWEPGDRLFVFGSGRAGSCAQTLVRLLGTVGVLRPDDDPAQLRDYLLTAYAVPATARDGADWARVTRLAAQLHGQPPVAVDYLGLWHAAGPPGRTGRTADLSPAVLAARHALAIDARVAPVLLGGDREDVQQVWFRGARCDLTRGRHASAALADIALEWVLDGAVAAGLDLADPVAAPASTADDALAGSAHPVPLRRVPEDAAVHASVERYLRAHPGYWRRLPARIRWVDPEWAARGERLMAVPPSTRIETLAAPPVLASVS